MGQRFARVKSNSSKVSKSVQKLTKIEKQALKMSWSTAGDTMAFFANNSLIVAFFKWFHRNNPHLPHAWMRLENIPLDELLRRTEFLAIASDFHDEFALLVVAVDKSSVKFLQLVQCLSMRYLERGLSEQDFQNIAMALARYLSAEDSLARLAWLKTITRVKTLMREHFAKLAAGVPPILNFKQLLRWL